MTPIEPTIDPEVRRTTNMQSSVSYHIKGAGWSADFYPDSDSIYLSLDKPGSYHERITFRVQDSIEMLKIIPEVIQQVLPLYSLNNKGMFKSKNEVVETRRLADGTRQVTNVLPLIEDHRNGKDDIPY